MTKQFSMDDYVDVAQRIAEFRSKYPEGSLQQAALEFRDFAGGSWVVFTAAAFRTPDDPRPGHGTAWEPVPGKTPYTRDSELQNAETAAWGRAIVAVLAADTKRGVASAQEIKSRQPDPLLKAKYRIMAAAAKIKPELKTEKALVDFITAATTAHGLSLDSASDLLQLAEEWEAAS